MCARSWRHPSSAHRLIDQLAAKAAEHAVLAWDGAPFKDALQFFAWVETAHGAELRVLLASRNPSLSLFPRSEPLRPPPTR